MNTLLMVLWGLLVLSGGIILALILYHRKKKQPKAYS